MKLEKITIQYHSSALSEMRVGFVGNAGGKGSTGMYFDRDLSPEEVAARLRLLADSVEMLFANGSTE
jgi:hypothetical protein